LFVVNSQPLQLTQIITGLHRWFYVKQGAVKSHAV
jgi:hypothetical protein